MVMGRPKLPKRAKRVAQLRVRLRADELQRAEKMARKAGQSVSAWVRSLILAAQE